MKRIKKFVALALAATMLLAPASSVFAKSAQTKDKPGNKASTETLTIPMYKENGKWKIDPMYAFIGIKNIKWNSKIVDLAIKKGAQKISLDTTWKYAPYALLIKQKGTIVPHKTAPTQTRDIDAEFWVYGPRQDILYTKHIVTLAFVQRETPIKSFIVGKTQLADDDWFATSNSEKVYKYANTAWRTIKVELQPYLKNLKLVAIRKDGRKEVIRSTSGRKFTCAYNFKELKAIEIRYTINRTSAAWKAHDYYNYLKDGVELPNQTGSLILNIK